MIEDERCCGSGTCIINAEGFCWCGQSWDGTRMCFAKADNGKTTEDDSSETVGSPADD